MGLADTVANALGGAERPAGRALPTLGLTDEERSSDAAYDRTGGNVAELQQAIASAKTPEIKATLQSQLAQINGPVSGGLADTVSRALSGQAANQPNAAPQQPAQPSARQAMPGLETPLSERVGKETTAGFGQAALNQATGLGASIIGGWRALAHLATGGGLQGATDIINEEQQKRTYEPTSASGKAIVGALASDYNPLNIPVVAGNYLGGKATDFLAGKVSPETAGAIGAGITTAVQTAPLLLLKDRPLKAGESATGDALLNKRTTVETTTPQITVNDQPAIWRKNAANQPEMAPVQAATAPAGATTAAPSGTAAPAVAARKWYEPPEKVSTAAPQPIESTIRLPEAGTPAAIVESEPVAGGLPKSAQAERAAVLQRVGIDKAWTSAVTGDALEGATNAQIAKFTAQPAGRAAAEMFAAERNALETHANNIAAKTGGTLGLDEETVHARGQTIAAPFDALRGYFDNAIKNAYNEAKTKSNGLPTVDPQPVDALFNERTFKNSAMAADKGNLLNAAKDEFQAFKENNPNGITVENAEQFRKWLNQNWSNENKHIIGRIKDAVDQAVMQSVGEDAYKVGRAMHQLKAATLDNPKGIARLMDVDPNTPMNRTTPFEKIPDTVTRLSVDQFKNVIKTLDEMPQELQPVAQSAKAEIKAQIANKIAEIGGKHQNQWNNKGVNDFLNKNGAKIAAVFTPEEISAIVDLRKAGNIVSVNSAYPGAAAQAALAAKQGLMSRVIPSITTSIGGAGGSLLGPAGAAGGAWVGRAAGESMAASSAEKAALKKVGKRMTNISDLTK